MLSTDDRRRVQFWRPDSPSVTAMLRVEHEDRARITYAEHFSVVVVYEGAFGGWYRGAVRVGRAKDLLRRGVLVAEAAQAVGFYDESQLHRHFRRIVGIAPGRFSRSFTGSGRTSQHRPSGARAIALQSPHERTHPQ